MSNLDRFESVFNAAHKPVFAYSDMPVQKVLVVTDLDTEAAAAFTARIQKLLTVLGAETEWVTLTGDDYAHVDELLGRLVDEAPDLICSYRNLKSADYKWPYSLGLLLNVLLRQVAPPVLVLPHPLLDDRYAWAEINTDRVLVVTDHLAGDAALVNWGVKFTEPHGRLTLAHVEDDEAYQHYMRIISKVPEVHTEEAAAAIKRRLLQEPSDYIGSCRGVIEALSRDVHVDEAISMGHRVVDYRRLVETHKTDLLVFRTRDRADADALALDGAAYAMALELRLVPLLMI